jgi:hydrogenase maturation protein HypF
MAAAYLGGSGRGLAVARRHADRWDAVVSLAKTAVRTSSAGRLFDAVAAVAGVRDVASYEGQAAIELEQRVDPDETGRYPARVAGGVLSGTDLVEAVAADVRAGVPIGTVAARFHAGLAAALIELVEAARVDCGLSTVALSGGVLQNAVMLGALCEGLGARGFEVLTHSRVPPNDGGISLGQAAVAAARDRAAESQSADHDDPGARGVRRAGHRAVSGGHVRPPAQHPEC